MTRQHGVMCGFAVFAGLGGLLGLLVFPPTGMTWPQETAAEMVPATALPTAEKPKEDHEEIITPINLGPGVNTPADEDDPFVPANGLLLVYASRARGSWDLWQAKRPTTTAKWGKGQPLAELNTPEADERSPFLWSRDGRLIFASNKVPDEKFKSLKNFDLWEQVGGREPTPLLQVDTPADELFPWVTPSGKEFYFSRKTPEGWRLFVAKGPLYGAVRDARPVEELPVGFHHATLSPDGLTMYLQGPLSQERWGLFRCTRKKVGGRWSTPEPLTRLNHPQGPRGDMSPCLGQGGTMLYFASDRPGGQGGLDLWVVPTAQLKTKKSGR
jgi:hypothetical protein